jgi:hypothetical protein
MVPDSSQKTVPESGSHALLILLANSRKRSISQSLERMEVLEVGNPDGPDGPDEFASSITFDEELIETGRRTFRERFIPQTLARITNPLAKGGED